MSKFNVGDRVMVVSAGTCLLKKGAEYTVEKIDDEGTACVTVYGSKGGSYLLSYSDHNFVLVSRAFYSFGVALLHLKNGKRVQRSGWNGKGMWLELQHPDQHSKMTLPYIFMFTAQGDRVPWLASQTDMLAEDWSEA